MHKIILLHGGAEHYLGILHPALVHFPIVLFTLTLLCDLLYGVGKTSAFKVGHWMLFGGLLMSIPTLVAGWEASESIPVHDAIYSTVIKHMTLAFITVSYALIYGIFRYIVVKKQDSIKPLVFVILSVILVFLTAWTSNYGGLISHGVSVF